MKTRLRRRARERSIPEAPARSPRPSGPWRDADGPAEEWKRAVRIGRARLNLVAPWRRKESS